MGAQNRVSLIARQARAIYNHTSGGELIHLRFAEAAKGGEDLARMFAKTGRRAARMQALAREDEGQARIVMDARRRMVEAHEPVAGAQMRIPEEIAPIADRRRRHASFLQAMGQLLPRMVAGDLAQHVVQKFAMRLARLAGREARILKPLATVQNLT